MTMKPSDLKNWWHAYPELGIKREDGRGLELPHYPENLWEIVKSYVDNVKGARMLDIGSNSGWFSIKFCKEGAWVIGVDNQQEAEGSDYNNGGRVEQGNCVAELLLTPEERQRMFFVKDDFLNLPYINEFNAVWFFGVYYHLPDHKKALPKINAMMKKGGVLYLESAVAAKCYDKKTINQISNDTSNFFVPTIDYLRHDLTNNGFAIVAECDASRPNVGLRHFFKAIKR